MKQRIRVVGIVRKGDDILLLKKNPGRVENIPLWELPTGKIEFAEQPDEAISRVIYDTIGISVTDIKLKDVITFVALSGSSRLYNLYIVYEINLNDEKIKLSNRFTQYKYLKYDATASMNVEEASMSVLNIEYGTMVPGQNQTFSSSNEMVRETANGTTLYTDGASKGNPGPAGIGYVILDERGHEIKAGGEFIGFATSRVAEYYGLKTGLEQAIKLGIKSLRVVSDNLMMINQMNGIYKVKNADLMPMYEDVHELLKKFNAVSFVHVKREFNERADEQANLAIERHFDENITEVSGDEIDTSSTENGNLLTV